MEKGGAGQMTDYISRADVLRYIAEDCRKTRAHLGLYRDNKAVQLDICRIPAADVAPVVHGRWIKSPDCPEEYDICSVCGLNDKHRTRADGEHPAFESIPLFCKWCGAKMDGVK